ncbi:MAG: transposase [Clostridia bacterium]|nr:transposase [Clostridia bacterium]
MPRKARKDLNTPYIHVMVQGINKEYIFDEEKYLKTYLQYMKEGKSDEQFVLLAYCMMNNHAHFLFWINDFDSFEKYMHKNNLKFALKYNKEKNRCGVVFRNRYQVEPIYDNSHLKNCIKYIHNNPVKAKMVSKCEDYPYSSYNEYVHNVGVANNHILKEIFGTECNYVELFEGTYDRKFIDCEGSSEVEDYIISGIAEFVKRSNWDLLQIFSERTVLKKLIFFLKNECNLSYKEIRDYLEMPRGLLNSMVKNKEE